MPLSLEQEVQKELKKIPQHYFPVWRVPFVERGKIEFLLLPEHCEEGVLIPNATGYTYERVGDRIECANIYCNRYLNALQSKSQSRQIGHAEAGDIPLLIQNGYGEQVPYTTVDPLWFQQLEFYDNTSHVSLVAEPVVREATYHPIIEQPNTDSTPHFTSGFESHVVANNQPWYGDLYAEFHLYGHRSTTMD